TLPVAAFVFRSDSEDFLLVAFVLVFPGSLLPFVSPWSRARELARQFKTVTVTWRTVSVGEETCDLSQCRWFRGFALHDPKLTAYRAYVLVMNRNGETESGCWKQGGDCTL